MRAVLRCRWGEGVEAGAEGAGEGIEDGLGRADVAAAFPAYGGVGADPGEPARFPRRGRGARWAVGPAGGDLGAAGARALSRRPAFRASAPVAWASRDGFLLCAGAA
jgi:hypothetical protein